MVLDQQLVDLAPVLRYHPGERYPACSPEAFLRQAELRRGTGQVICESSVLTLDWLSRDPYPDGRRWQTGDHLARTHWRILPTTPELEHVVYARWAVEGPDRWAQYWWFHAKNSYHGAWGGIHLGDWEGIQLRVPSNPGLASGNPSEPGEPLVPDLAVYAQHQGGEVRPWSDVETIDGHPVVDVALGSHASHFAATGLPGRRLVVPAPHVESFGSWAMWPGRWGESSPGWFGWYASSPTGPGTKQRWHHSSTWAKRVDNAA